MTQLIQNNPQTPNIQPEPLLLTRINLGRKILPRPTHRRPFFRRTDQTSEAKIRQLQMIIVIEQQILEFDVAMQNVEAVDVVDGLAQFLEDKGDLVVGEFAVLLHVLEERAVGGVLEDEVDVRALFYFGVEADDVLMAEGGLDFYFLLDVLEFSFF